MALVEDAQTLQTQQVVLKHRSATGSQSVKANIFKEEAGLQKKQIGNMRLESFTATGAQ